MDDAAAAFAAALADELGEDGRFEADFQRAIWYANLVHFTASPRDPGALLEWVAKRRHRGMGVSHHTEAQLAVWRFDGRHAVPVVLGSARLSG